MVAFDGDRAGRTAAEELTAALANAGCASQIVPLPTGSDINAVVRHDGDWIRRHLDTTAGTDPIGHELARTMRSTQSRWR